MSILINKKVSILNLSGDILLTIEIKYDDIINNIFNNIFNENIHFQIIIKNIIINFIENCLHITDEQKINNYYKNIKHLFNFSFIFNTNIIYSYYSSFNKDKLISELSDNTIIEITLYYHFIIDLQYINIEKYFNILASYKIIYIFDLLHKHSYFHCIENDYKITLKKILKFFTKDFIITIVRENLDIFDILPEKLKLDICIWLEIVKHYGLGLFYIIFYILQKQKENNNNLIFPTINDFYKNYNNNFLNNDCITIINNYITDEIIYEAIKSDGRIYIFIIKNNLKLNYIKNNNILLDIAIKSNGYIIKDLFKLNEDVKIYIGYTKTTEELILLAINSSTDHTTGTYLLKCIPDNFKNNKKIILDIVSNNGEELEFVCDELKHDIDIS